MKQPMLLPRIQAWSARSFFFFAEPQSFKRCCTRRPKCAQMVAHRFFPGITQIALQRRSLMGCLISRSANNTTLMLLNSGVGRTASGGLCFVCLCSCLWGVRQDVLRRIVIATKRNVLERIRASGLHSLRMGALTAAPPAQGCSADRPPSLPLKPHRIDFHQIGGATSRLRITEVPRLIP